MPPMKNQTSFTGRIWQKAPFYEHLESIYEILLKKRKLTTPEKIQKFLAPDFHDLPDPWNMKGMKKAVDRIEQAIEKKERIMIFGDFDADGITSTVILVEGLRQLGAHVSYRIPDRNTHSHGLKRDAIKEIVSQEVSLLITCDCGTNDHEEVALAHELGMDVIVTDHHMSDPAQFPHAALAVINPHQPGCPYRGKGLSGAGVAWKLLSALAERNGKGHDFLAPFLEVCALGTVADCMQLTGENRILVKHGLQQLKQTQWSGLALLLERANILPENMDEDTIRFCIAPRLNAASRIGNVTIAAQLFLGEASGHAQRVAQLEQWNNDRQVLLQETLEQSFSQVRSHASCQTLHHPSWRPGVLGLVASRQVEMFRVPVIASSIREDGLLTASCRAPEGCSMISALHSAPELFGQFGGHDGAAGFVTSPEKWEAVIEALDTYFNRITRTTTPLSVDAWISPSLLNGALLQFLKSLAPFGPGNGEPVFGIRSVQVEDFSLMGEKKNHIRISGIAEDRRLDFTAFFADEFIDRVNVGQTLDIACTVSENIWNGERRLQLRVEDMRETT